MNGLDLFLGIVCALAAAACFDGATLVQASEARAQDMAHGLRARLLWNLARRPRWVAGLALGGLGWPLQIVALRFAPLTLVQPALGLGPVLLLAFSHRVLGERVGRRQWLAAATMLAGIGVLAGAAPHRSDAVSSHVAVAAIASVLTVLALVPLLASRTGARRAAGGPAMVVGAGGAFALSAVATKLLSDAIGRGEALHALGWAALVAGASVVGLLLDASALQCAPAARVAPPIFAFEVAVPALAAPLAFHEGWGSTPGGGAVVAAGLLLVVAGGALLGSSGATLEQLEHDVGRRGQRPVRAVGWPRDGERPPDRGHEVAPAGDDGGKPEAPVGMVVEPDVPDAPAVGDDVAAADLGLEDREAGGGLDEDVGGGHEVGDRVGEAEQPDAVDRTEARRQARP